MRLTGQEIKDMLEMSYGLWTAQMKTPDDHVMLLDYVLDEGRRLGFKHLAYNFDSAAGICYTVDVTKPYGEKIRVTGMADGSAFGNVVHGGRQFLPWKRRRGAVYQRCRHSSREVERTLAVQYG
jgi:2',3'-cyclic-nucleotide 2'-phosphodiesterase (5'-nucleotidase family)